MEDNKPKYDLDYEESAVVEEYEKPTTIWNTFFGLYCAGMLSAYLGNSFWWILLHAFCGWYYVAFKIIQKFHIYLIQ